MRRNMSTSEQFINMLLENIKPGPLSDVYKVISTFSEQDKKFMGARQFYDSAEYRIIDYSSTNGEPIGYLELKFGPNREWAKINWGLRPKSRGKRAHKGMRPMTKLWNRCLEDNKGIIIVGAIDKENIASIKFSLKMGMKKITSTAELKKYKFYEIRGNCVFFKYVNK